MGKGLTCDVVSGSGPSQVNCECLFGIALHGLAGLLILQGDEDDGVPATQRGRVRLNRGGDRQANAALYRIVLTRMSRDERTRTYVARRRAEGKNTAEIMRCLKRYVARETFKHLPRTA